MIQLLGSSHKYLLFKISCAGFAVGFKTLTRLAADLSRDGGRGVHALPAIATALILAACQRVPDVQFFEGDTEGTTFHVTVSSLPPQVSRTQVQAAIDAVLAEVDVHLSTYRPDSEISRFNASSSTDWLPASAALLTVITEAQRVSRESKGAFDVTVGPLVDLWGFGKAVGEPGRIPSAAEIATARESLGFDKLDLREMPPAIRKRSPALRMDVAGIAPGYAVDRICRSLERLGVRDAIVEIGGEVRAWGRHPDGRPWRAAVEMPLAGERRPYTLVELNGMAVSTSGDYRDYRIVGGRRISHTFDPRTGAPVTHGLASVTVLHASAMTADAYATTLMVLGPEEGYRYAEQHQLAALFLQRLPGQAGWRERVTPQFSRLRRPVP
jgi:thiamine biosynthesis lipoprotein